MDGWDLSIYLRSLVLKEHRQSDANKVWSEHLNIVHNQKNSPEHKSENGFLVNPPKIVGESHRPS